MFQAAVGGAMFPYGTLVVNVTGCFAIGFLSQLTEAMGFLGPQARAFVVVGFLGGYTTFSAFGNETVNLFNGSEGLAATVNVAAHIILVLGAVWLGRISAYLIWR